MQKHNPKLYYCKECRLVFAGHHNPGEEGEAHYTPPEDCDYCGGETFVEYTG